MGGGHHVNIEQKRGVTCYLHGLQGGGGGGGRGGGALQKF